MEKSGEVSTELYSMLEIILRILLGNSIPFGGVVIICTLDHNQLTHVKGIPFLVSYHIFSCFKR